MLCCIIHFFFGVKEETKTKQNNDEYTNSRFTMSPTYDVLWLGRLLPQNLGLLSVLQRSMSLHHFSKIKREREREEEGERETFQ